MFGTAPPRVPCPATLEHPKNPAPAGDLLANGHPQRVELTARRGTFARRSLPPARLGVVVADLPASTREPDIFPSPVHRAQVLSRARVDRTPLTRGIPEHRAAITNDPDIITARPDGIE